LVVEGVEGVEGVDGVDGEGSRGCDRGIGITRGGEGLEERGKNQCGGEGRREEKREKNRKRKKYLRVLKRRGEKKRKTSQTAHTTLFALLLFSFSFLFLSSLFS